MLVREWFVLFTSLAKCYVAVSKLDNVYGSATAMKLCIVALWLPEAFLAIQACLTRFWKSSLEASYMFMLQMLVWPGLCPCCSCGCSWKCSALPECLTACSWLHPNAAAPSLLLFCWAHLHQRSWVLTPQTWSICRKGLRMSWVKVGLMQEQRLLDTLASWFSRLVAPSH